jgi:hypothetical protein
LSAGRVVEAFRDDLFQALENDRMVIGNNNTKHRSSFLRLLLHPDTTPVWPTNQIWHNPHKYLCFNEEICKDSKRGAIRKCRLPLNLVPGCLKGDALKERGSLLLERAHDEKIGKSEDFNDK